MRPRPVLIGVAIALGAATLGFVTGRMSGTDEPPTSPPPSPTRNEGFAVAVPGGATIDGETFLRRSSARIHGVVRDDTDGLPLEPVEGATVILPDFGVRTTTGADGSFGFPDLRFPVPGQCVYLRVIVRAEGFGTWRADRIPLFPGNGTTITPNLRAAPVHDRENGARWDPNQDFCTSLEDWPERYYRPIS